MKRKIISILTAVSMLMSLIPLIGAVPVSAAGTDASSIQIGDYVQMGTYYERPILWRCVAFEKITGYDTNGNPITDSTDTVTTYQDGYLPLMMSDKILCLKAFDAKTSANTETGSHSRSTQRTTAGTGVTAATAYIATACSSYWADSNIRCWLNSDAAAGNVEWLCGNPPSGSSVGVKYNAYDQEAGFLTSFSSDEKAAIKTVTQKSILIECDKNAVENTTGTEPFASSGEVNIISNISGNYTNAYSELVTDTMFLPDVQQISNLYANNAILGDGYHRALISAGAYNANNCLSADSFNAFTNSSPWHYWLRTPSDNDYNTNPYSVYYIKDTGGFEGIVASDGLYGVRPAFYLNTAAALAGSGTAETPYTIEHQHNLVKHAAVPATCTEDGTGEYYKCEGENSCGKMFSDAAGTTEISEIPTLTATGHSWGAWGITKQPTTTAAGTAKRVCENNISHTDTLTLPVLTNTTAWAYSILQTPTCTEKGLLQCTLKAEPTIKVNVQDDATGHSWGSWNITTEPTSSTTGTAQRVCANDSAHIDTVELPDLTDTDFWTLTSIKAATITEDGWQEYTSDYGTVTVIIPALTHTHNWGEWELTTEPTETKTGIATRVCKTNAEHKETKDVPVLTDEDVWTAMGGSLPTCTTKGATDYYSDDYGTVTVIYPATGHSWGDWNITSNPTLTATGEAERVCENNGEHTETAVLPVLGNTTVWTAGKLNAATCTKSGSQTYTSIYGKVTVIYPATGHSWGSWEITTKPTLTETGTAERTCANDSAHIDKVDLPILTDTAVWTAGSSKAATITEDGWQEYNSDYGTVTVIIPALTHTHNWGEWELTTEPTETKTGIATRVCTLDENHTEAKVVPELTDEGVWTAMGGSLPTCTEDGETDYYSEDYGHVLATIPATGHSWGSWYITSNPTHTDEGEAQRTCTKDSSHKDTITLPVLTDTDVWTPGTKVDPTCTVDGSQTYTSTYGTVTITLPATDHVWGSWSITLEPTLTTGGTAQRTCTIDSSHKDTAALPALTDTDVWTAGAKVEPTESTDGSQIYTSEYGNVTVVLPATGHTHDWGAWSITTEPTETTTGIATRVCQTNDEHKDAVTLPVLTDTGVWVKGTRVEPTETTAGSQEYNSIYGTVTVVLPALKYSIEYKDGKAVVNVSKAGTHAVIFAAYDADGKLISVEAQTVTLEKGETSVSPLTFNATGATKVKVMLWDSLTNMKPLCNSDEQ